MIYFDYVVCFGDVLQCCMKMVNVIRVGNVS